MKKKEVFEMLVLYGLVYMHIIAFFASFAIISTGYLIWFLIKRRYSRTQPETDNHWAMPPKEASGFKSLA
jgi:hypothetical protein